VQLVIGGDGGADQGVAVNTHSKLRAAIGGDDHAEQGMAVNQTHIARATTVTGGDNDAAAGQGMAVNTGDSAVLEQTP
jgi:hypothetical protein